MLLKVTDSNLWYANIVNFMVSGYVCGRTAWIILAQVR
jgi:hypothetical protein